MKRTSFVLFMTVALVLILALSASAATVSCSGVAAWSANSVSYAVGALVTYDGSEYKCIQAHTSEAGWDPADVPALWSLVGTCSSGGATPTPTATATATAKPTATATATATAKPTATATATATAKPTATATPSGGSCWAAWSSTTAYNGGAEVSYSGENYEAAYWTEGNNPSTSSGAAGSGEPWIPEGSCSAGPTPTPSPTPKPTPTATPCSGCGGSTGFIFSPYKDVTVDANWNTGEQQSTVTGTSEAVTQAMPNSTLTWAFATGTCGSETWAGITPALEASNVQQFVSAGKKYIISTGGADGQFDCPSASAFASFINTYYSANMIGVDFDIEDGQSQATIDDLINAVKGVEGQFPNMRFSFTVASFGTTAANPIFNATGVMVVDEIKRLGLGGNYTINPMAFDFGGANPSYCTVVSGACEMGESAIGAMEAVNQQYGLSYGNIEVTLEVPTDDEGEPFTSSDVTTLCSWMRSNGAAGVHFWSFDRDTDATYSKSIPSACGTN